MTRDLTYAERAVIETLGRAASAAAQLPVLHESDIPEFVHHTHVLQNIIYARPAFEAEKEKW